MTLLAGGCAIDTSENHCAVLHVAFNDEELAAIGDPSLMPHSSRVIVNTEALAFVAVDALVVLVNNAAIENAIDAHTCVFCGGAKSQSGPNPQPKIQILVFISRR